MSLTFEQSKSRLSAIDSTHNTSFYNHLTSLLHTILTSPDNTNALAEFERLSLDHKANRQHHNTLHEHTTTYLHSALNTPTANNVINNKNVAVQLKKASQLVANSIKPDKVGLSQYMSDLYHDSAVLKDAGIAVLNDDTEMYTLQLSIEQLVRASEYKINNVRFWGKLQGRTSDYYVVECKRAAQAASGEQADEQADVMAEPANTGVNEYVYYVSNVYNDASAWQVLPDLLPQHIVQARSVRTLLTGQLTSKVHGYAFNEATYVRALIARITHTCSIAPTGQYAVETTEDDQEILIPDAEYEPADTTELESYVHTRPLLLKQGRVTKYVPPEPASDDEGEEDEKSAEPEVEPEEDEPLPLLSSLSEDTHDEMKQVWVVRNTKRPELPHATVLLKSLIWPGAYSVVNGRTTLNVYIGNGLKQLGKPYKPVQPAPLQSEYVAVQADDDSEPISLAEQADVLPPPPQEHSDTEEKTQDDEQDEEDEDQ